MRLSMLNIPDKLTKRYYSIGEVADMFGVSKSLIRFWESEFEILRPYKNSKGDRRFTPQNIQQFKLIYHLVKERGFTLKGARKEIQANKTGRDQRKKMVRTLKNIRSFLEEIKEEL